MDDDFRELCEVVPGEPAWTLSDRCQHNLARAVRAHLAYAAELGIAPFSPREFYECLLVPAKSQLSERDRELRRETVEREAEVVAFIGGLMGAA